MIDHAELEVAQQYAAGKVDPAGAAAFEEHLLICEQCQTEVRLAVGLRRVIRAAPVRPANRNRWVIGAGALLAAGIAAFITSTPRIDGAVAGLGRVADPPAYIGMNVRAAAEQSDSLFSAAMTAYVARRYRGAESGLRAALAAGVDSVPAEFFLASAQLMSGHAEAAASGYARVIAAGPAASAYLAEAHLYRARALLRRGRAAEALSELAAVSRSDTVNAAKATALADSVIRVLRR
jgi:hypothetical protein